MKQPAMISLLPLPADPSSSYLQPTSSNVNPLEFPWLCLVVDALTRETVSTCVIVPEDASTNDVGGRHTSKVITAAHRVDAVDME